jgi:hypothetical protein
MAERISRADYAKRRGVSRSAVTKAVRSGRITLIDGQWIDPVAADAQWAHHTDPTQSQRARGWRAAAPAAPPVPAPVPQPPPFDGRGLLEAKRRREDALAQIAELELAEKRKVLINVEQLKPALMRAFHAHKTELLSLPDKWKAELDLLYGTDIDVEVLRRGINDALLHLSRYNYATNRFDAKDEPDPGDEAPSRSDPPQRDPT